MELLFPLYFALALVFLCLASLVSKNEIPSDQYALEIAGVKVKKSSVLGPRPVSPIEIYEYERTYGELFSCPFWKKVDPNTGIAMYESYEIIRYLVGKYGDGNVPLLLSLGRFTTLTESFAMIGRMGKASPFCKVVHEVLVELELPQKLHSCARGSPKRQALYQRVGNFQIPYSEDPNTGVQMFKSADIVEYLESTYAL